MNFIKYVCRDDLLKIIISTTVLVGIMVGKQSCCLRNYDSPHHLAAVEVAAYKYVVDGQICMRPELPECA